MRMSPKALAFYLFPFMHASEQLSISSPSLFLAVPRLGAERTTERMRLMDCARGSPTTPIIGDICVHPDRN